MLAADARRSMIYIAGIGVVQQRCQGVDNNQHGAWRRKSRWRVHKEGQQVGQRWGPAVMEAGIEGCGVALSQDTTQALKHQRCGGLCEQLAFISLWAGARGAMVRRPVVLTDPDDALSRPQRVRGRLYASLIQFAGPTKAQQH
jgi:hypothetical protein